MFVRPLAVAFVLLVATAARAELAVPDLLADHMVVQRDRPIPVWGRGDSGQSVRVDVDGGAAVSATVAADGAGSLDLPAVPAGGPHAIHITSAGRTITLADVMAGDVWVAADQSNMAFRMAPQLPWTLGVPDHQSELAHATDAGVRMYTAVPESVLTPAIESHGLWEPTTPANARDFSAVAFYFARRVSRNTHVPVGVLSASVGSTAITSWMAAVDPAELAAARSRLAKAGGDAKYRQSVPAYWTGVRAALPLDKPWPPTAQPYPNYQFQPTGFYNGMVAPLGRVPIKGVIWYQGEADADHATAYTARFARLADQWRHLWRDPALPIYFVQLPNFDPAAERVHGKPKPGADKLRGTWAAMRAAQAACLAVPHTGMAVTIDVGSADLIHPRDKQPVGDRLARLALRDTYAQPIAATAPIVARVEPVGHDLRLTFDGPVTLRGDGGFDVAPAGGSFHSARASVVGNTVTLTAPDVPAPTRGRYAGSDAPTATAFGPAGLPVAPFETRP